MSGDDNGYAIRVQGLSKVFKLYSSPFNVVKEVLTGAQYHEEFWALRDVSFEVAKGEAVGIMGRNGAGKSTLLRILAGTLDRTSGEMDIRGKVSAILELGSGFSPDRTGRENIVNGGLCLGMSLDEIRDKMDSIIDFSELREFIDHPFRTYSSGMQARLTFATAVAVDPEVLIVDEALSVGDAKFQKKCFDRMNAIRDEGRTILVVSHSENTITQFCDRAILLEKGQIELDNTPKKVTMRYFDLLYGTNEASVPDASTTSTVPSTSSSSLQLHPHAERVGPRDKAEVVDIGIFDKDGRRVTRLSSGEQYRLHSRILFHQDLDDYNYGFMIRNVKGLLIFAVDTRSEGIQMPPAKKGDELLAEMNITLWLTNGDYFMSCGPAHDNKMQDFCYDALQFHIDFLPFVQYATLVNLQHRFDTSLVSANSAV